MRLRPDAPRRTRARAGRESPGLAHIAFEIRGSIDDLRAAKAELESAGVVIRHDRSHGFAESIYLLDPDANEVELFVDTSSA